MKNELITPQKALALIMQNCQIMPHIEVDIYQACGYFTAFDLNAKIDNPRAKCSSMDGFALRIQDLREIPASFNIIETVPAGKIPEKIIRKKQAAKVFTGSIIPKFANIVVPQENTSFDEKIVTINSIEVNKTYIRKKASDFKYQQKIIPKGKKIRPEDLSLIATANYRKIKVRKKPKIAIICCGNEITPPEYSNEKNKVVYSNYFLLHALATKYGAKVTHFYVAKDNIDDIKLAITNSLQCDIILTVGGASVGKYDLVKEALETFPYNKIFQNIAMRPGKPIFAGKIQRKIQHMNNVFVLGLPGNPVSSYVGAEIFLKKIIEKMCGYTQKKQNFIKIKINKNLTKNDQRQTYLRASIKIDKNHELCAKILNNQDSASNKTISQTQALIVRRPNAPYIPKGTKTQAIIVSEFDQN